MSKSKAELITKWSKGGKDYRLLALSYFTHGYEDTVVLERDDKDTLGDPRWVTVAQWAGANSRNKTNDDETLMVLTALVKDLLSERDQARRTVENMAQRERMEAGHA